MPWPRPSGSHANRAPAYPIGCCLAIFTLLKIAPVETSATVCEMLHRLQSEFALNNLQVDDESGYYDSSELEPLLRMTKIIDDAINHPELVMRLMR
jgi:hypothetical protein